VECLVTWIGFSEQSEWENLIYFQCDRCPSQESVVIVLLSTKSRDILGREERISATIGQVVWTIDCYKGIQGDTENRGGSEGSKPVCMIGASQPYPDDPVAISIYKSHYKGTPLEDRLHHVDLPLYQSPSVIHNRKPLVSPELSRMGRDRGGSDWDEKGDPEPSVVF
jgi:hypothetical protein